MIILDDLSLSFSGNVLFEHVNAKFLPGNCYGLIGANGAGKSSLLKVLSSQLDASSGNVIVDSNLRLSVLKQDQFAYDAYSVLDTVIMGHSELYKVYAERKEIYEKEDMSEEDGIRVGELEDQFAELDGYNLEAEAEKMLSELGFSEQLFDYSMSELEAGQKIRVLLAQAIFGDPDILLLDEPTNQLDYQSVLWLENFLLDYQKLAIVISHDRHFLNKVCTHIANLDYKKLEVYVGNYSFWEQASQLAMKQKKEDFKQREEKVKELEDFVRRFSANASKSKQATSRKKLIEKLRPDAIPETSRRYPYINFDVKRPCGGKILTVDNISYSVNDTVLLKDVSFTLDHQDKVAILGDNSLSKSALLDILSGKLTPDSGTVTWGDTIQFDYFPKDHSHFFEKNLPLLEWLGQFADTVDNQELRGLLGRMLFSGDDVFKKIAVLSGGEKARSMFSKMMLSKANVLLFDEPTDHLDLEAISSLNKAFKQYPEIMLIISNDFELLDTVCNRVIEVSPVGMIDQKTSFDDYMTSDAIQKQRAKLVLV
tara:strand:- start:690 stop:2306 length:1617 start_codon:yes stop_codon:yes gene_type:complete